jgi:hypothetical protein
VEPPSAKEAVVIPPASIKLRTIRRTRVFIGLSGFGVRTEVGTPAYPTFVSRKFVGCSKTERFSCFTTTEIVGPNLEYRNLGEEKRFGKTRPTANADRVMPIFSADFVGLPTNARFSLLCSCRVYAACKHPSRIRGVSSLLGLETESFLANWTPESAIP